MNNKILAMVRRTPGIKTGQIADQLDVTFAEAQDMLAKLVNDGLLKGGLQALAGGGKVMSYELTDKGSKLKPPQPFGKPPVEPKPAIPDPQPTSKIQRAILHIEKNGPTRTPALRPVMDLLDGANVANYLANYLAPAVKNGRLHFDDGLWKLGPASSVKAENVETDYVTKTPIKVASPTAIPVPKKTYRCAIWTDGTVEISKSGQHIELTQAELDEIAMFVSMRRVA